MTEADLLRAVTDLARWLGLRYFHDNDSRRNRAGFPDLVVAGQGGFIFRELKAEKGRLRPEQLDWISRLDQGGADVGIWRPSDLQPNGGRIKEELIAITKGKP
jgi:hypothetical protein